MTSSPCSQQGWRSRYSWGGEASIALHVVPCWALCSLMQGWQHLLNLTWGWEHQKASWASGQRVSEDFVSEALLLHPSCQLCLRPRLGRCFELVPCHKTRNCIPRLRPIHSSAPPQPTHTNLPDALLLGRWHPHRPLALSLGWDFLVDLAGVAAVASWGQALSSSAPAPMSF